MNTILAAKIIGALVGITAVAGVTVSTVAVYQDVTGPVVSTITADQVPSLRAPQPAYRASTVQSALVSAPAAAGSGGLIREAAPLFNDTLLGDNYGTFDADLAAYLDAAWNQGLLTGAQADNAIAKLRGFERTGNKAHRNVADAAAASHTWIGHIVTGAGAGVPSSVGVTDTDVTVIGDDPAAGPTARRVLVTLSLTVGTVAGKTVPVETTLDLTVTPAPGAVGWTRIGGGAMTGSLSGNPS